MGVFVNDREKANRQITISSRTKRFDLTANITSKTVVFPGDPIFSSDTISSLKDGKSFQLCLMRMSNHTGTHIDFPAHVQENGKTSSDYSLEDLIGSGLIIEVPKSELSITKQFIQAQTQIQKNDFVFFKTANSAISKEAPFTSKYVYIEPNAAEELVKKGVKIVGIDYISVDALEKGDLPVHNILLSHDVLIVEGLVLDNVPIGRNEIFIITNNIPNMDGLPARVFIQELV